MGLTHPYRNRPRVVGVEQGELRLLVRGGAQRARSVAGGPRPYCAGTLAGPCRALATSVLEDGQRDTTIATVLVVLTVLPLNE